MQVELIPCTKMNTLHIDGFLYRYQYKRSHNRTYWLCRKSQSIHCTARAVIENGSDIIIHQGPYDSAHNHSPNYEEVYKLRRKADNLHNEFAAKKAHFQPLDLSTKLRHQADLTCDERYFHGRSLKRCEVIYRCFLKKFLERPVFTKKVIYAALKHIYKSYTAIRSNYYDIIKYRSQIEADLVKLRSDPDAVILPLVISFKQDWRIGGCYLDSTSFMHAELTAQDGNQGNDYNVFDYSRPESCMNWLDQIESPNRLIIDLTTGCSEKKENFELDYPRNSNIPVTPSSVHSARSQEFVNYDELQSICDYSTNSSRQSVPVSNVNHSLAYGYSIYDKNIPTVTDQRVPPALQPSPIVLASHYLPIMSISSMNNNITSESKVLS